MSSSFELKPFHISLSMNYSWKSTNVPDTYPCITYDKVNLYYVINSTYYNGLKYNSYSFVTHMEVIGKGMSMEKPSFIQ
jgi:hypothetical protein